MQKRANRFQCKRQPRLFSRGMTLIELLVTMFLAILMIAVGLPGFLTLRQGQTQNAAINETYGLLQFARSLAMTDATRVTFCTSSNQLTCSGSSNFAQGGVILAQDQNGNDVLVRVIDPVSADDVVIKLNGFLSNSQIQFNDVGEIMDLTTAASLVFCDSRGSKDANALIINPLGMVRMATDDDNDNIINIHTTSNIQCS